MTRLIDDEHVEESHASTLPTCNENILSLEDDSWVTNHEFKSLERDAVRVWSKKTIYGCTPQGVQLK